SRFVGQGGRLLYIGDTASSRNEGGKLMYLETEYLESLGIPPMSHDKLPDVVVFDEAKGWLFLSASCMIRSDRCRFLLVIDHIETLLVP
ncbi:MAG: hypothetical protein IH810_05315, partial [Proteobacteria bacterium]|nr:hypothetical protein [Pseudomonadota bacterium]